MASRESETRKIESYLRIQNRPYNINDIFLNLHKEIGKTNVQRSLDQLVATGTVREKVYGKQKVYVIDQSQFPEVKDAELKVLEKEVSVLADELTLKQQEVLKIEAELKAAAGQLTTREAVQQAEEIAKENAGLEARLRSLQQQTVTVTREERDLAATARDFALTQWRKRKRIAKDILDAILENYLDSKQKLYEEIGIETDEDVGIKMPL